MNEPRTNADVDRLVDAAICLCHAKLESATAHDRRIILRALASAVETPYQAGDDDTAVLMALATIAALSGQAGAAADALATATNPPASVYAGRAALTAAPSNN
ncbi:hypothetical protein [Paludisphaera soli]|uniref:hypothetical protein n=1 Tax=Paludisphaera soli TaxID=2712865 RepID=UPI0013ED260C|nr:hypothetical protein [Paludisphaera soli]